MKTHLFVILIVSLAQALTSCKEKSLTGSDAKIDQFDSTTVTEVARNAELKFSWTYLNPGKVGDGPLNSPEFALYIQICADHEGKDSCVITDFDSGYYSKSYPYMTPHYRKDNFPSSHEILLYGDTINDAALGKKAYSDNKLRKLPKRIQDNDVKFGEYYLNFVMYEEDAGWDDFMGYDCKYFQDVVTGAKFIINGKQGSKAIIEVISAGHTGVVQKDITLFNDEKEDNQPLVEREGC